MAVSLFIEFEGAAGAGENTTDWLRALSPAVITCA